MTTNQRLAILKAIEWLGNDFRLKGRFHHRRAVVSPQLSRNLRMLSVPHESVCIGPKGGARYVYPIDILEAANESLGVKERISYREV